MGIGISRNRYLNELTSNGVQIFIENISCEYVTVEVFSKIIPLSISNDNYSDCYNVSAYSAFIKSPALSASLWMKPIYIFFGLLLKSLQLNKVVLVNNYLLGNNFGLDLSSDELKKLHEILVKNFPKHLIVFRSLYKNLGSAIEQLEKIGYIKLPVMNNYFFENTAKIKQRRDFKRDIEELSNEVGIDSELSGADFDKIKELYSSLYLEKYNKFSPHITTKFIELTYKSGFIKYFVLRDNNKKIKAVSGIINWGDIITIPIIGYEQDQPLLYRKIFAVSLKYAYENKKILAAGAGVSDFKINRGASKNTEYALVYINHLTGFRGNIISKMIKLADLLSTRFLRYVK